jgi:PEP-CTERM motif-containing protein
VDFLLRDPLGVFQDQTGTVDIAVSAQVVPEPSTWLLVATGMIAALYWRRRVAW